MLLIDGKQAERRIFTRIGASGAAEVVVGPLLCIKQAWDIWFGGQCILPLDASCREYTGRLLYVRPFYGWGWWAYDESGPIVYTQEQMAGPAPFHLCIAYFYEFDGFLTGAVGKIEEIGHPYNGFHAVFYLHREGLANFTDNVATYNIQLGPSAPYLGMHEPDTDNDWPLWAFTSRPYIGGYAEIGANKETVSGSETG